MSTADRLKRAVKEPRLFIRGLNRAYHRRFGKRTDNTAGIDVFDEDWDTLVVLDACRFDMFEQHCQIEGNLSSRISRGSATTEWLKSNVDGRDLSDTVYVTANPQLERHREQWDVNIHAIENVWMQTGWDDENGTVLAETMTRAAKEAIGKYPNKRLVVHYMQPHYPFVPSSTTFDKKHLETVSDDDKSAEGENIWNQMFMGNLDISRDELWEIYVDNLRYVLGHVKELLGELEGKTVITSDHGNYVGERASPIPIREWGHPRGLYDHELVRVPWLVCTKGQRRTIVAGEADETPEDVESNIVTERLRDLGYAE